MSVDPAELFSKWAPETSHWSPWAKPVLFTYPSPIDFTPLPEPALSADAAPSTRDRVAVVVDMPGTQSVACGLVLAERGFRPVPLFNTTFGPGSNLHDVGAILSCLIAAADRLAALRIPDDAPPAFLIDSSRIEGNPAPLTYDNRWMVFPQDFPSARALRAAGLESAVIVRREGKPIEADLRAVLRYWHRDGFTSRAFDPMTRVHEELAFYSSWISFLTDHTFAWMMGLRGNGLRRNSAGGFGGVVPMPQATSGGGWA
jgi:hypothetical protein